MVKLRCINPFSSNKISLRMRFPLEFPSQGPDTCLKVPCFARPHCSAVDPPLPSTRTCAGGQEEKWIGKITVDIMAKQELPFSRSKRGSSARTFTGSVSQAQQSGWKGAQKLRRHKNIKRPNTRAKASRWKGFLDFAMKVKLRTKTSMKNFINEKRTGVLWKHMNVINHNPTPATITDAQVLLEPRVQTLF